MGDYNDEPFNQSLEAGLLAIRDRSKASKTFRVPLQPFLASSWGTVPTHTSSQSGWLQRHVLPQRGGTYVVEGVRPDLFSGFLSWNGDWHLNEKLTQIVRMTNGLDSKILNGRGVFDHCPVISFIEQ